MTPDSHLTRMFVNGQAMSGGSLNGPLSAGGTLIGPVRTSDDYRFWSWRDDYPALQRVPNGGWHVPGELYAVPFEVLREELLPREPPELELAVIRLEDGSGALSMRLRDGVEPAAPDWSPIPYGLGWRAYPRPLHPGCRQQPGAVTLDGVTTTADVVAKVAANAATGHGFGSDNQSGAHPRMIAAIAAANAGHVVGYGADPYTEALNAEVAPLFGPLARIYPAFGGTGANVTALAAMCDRWQAVLCPTSAHLTRDEAGAIESVAGIKAVGVPAVDGKINPDALDEALTGFSSVHQVEPAVLTLTQATEVGTTYTPAELGALCEHAHRRGLLVHLDGARLSNAAAFLGCSLAAITGDAGVDVLTLGGAKNGMLFGEAIVVLQPDATPKLLRAQKTLGQLLSKQRYVSAQLLELFGTSLWRELAEQANAGARLLDAGLRPLPDVQVRYPAQANVVFLEARPAVAAMLAERFRCQASRDPRPAVRVMASWDTEPADAAELVSAVRELVLPG